MAVIDKVVIIPKGNYSATATYNKLDMVRYEGCSWMCKVNGTIGITPAENTNWTLIVQDGSVSGNIAWNNVTSKPFSTISSTDFKVENNELQFNGSVTPSWNDVTSKPFNTLSSTDFKVESGVLKSNIVGESSNINNFFIIKGISLTPTYPVDIYANYISERAYTISMDVIKSKVNAIGSKIESSYSYDNSIFWIPNISRIYFASSEDTVVSNVKCVASNAVLSSYGQGDNRLTINLSFFNYSSSPVTIAKIYGVDLVGVALSNATYCANGISFTDVI